MSGTRNYAGYVEALNKLLRDPTEALDASQLIRDERHRTFHFSKDDTLLFSAAAKRINIKKAQSCRDDYYAIPSSFFTLDHKRGIGAFVNQDVKPFLNSIELQILDRASFWDIIVMSSVVNSLIQMLMLEQHEKFLKDQSEVMTEERTRALRAEVQNFKQDFLLPCYIRKQLFWLASDLVIEACNKQLDSGLIPQEYRRIVRNIKNTTKSMDESFNSADYLRNINLLPLERTWARVIIGASLAAAGLALAATALTLGVMTMVVWLAFAGVAGLALTSAGTFFANSKHADSEVAESAKLWAALRPGMLS